MNGRLLRRPHRRWFILGILLGSYLVGAIMGLIA
jgi:hypothetical protein